jgi:hypothetical protein
MGFSAKHHLYLILSTKKLPSSIMSMRQARILKQSNYDLYEVAGKRTYTFVVTLTG